MKSKFKIWRKVERMEFGESKNKTERGAVDAPQIKIKIHNSYNNNDY